MLQLIGGHGAVQPGLGKPPFFPDRALRQPNYLSNFSVIHSAEKPHFDNPGRRIASLAKCIERLVKFQHIN